TPKQLGDWLDTLNDTGAEINVIIEACLSGSFIDKKEVTDSLSRKSGRVIISSNDAVNNAYASAQGAYFSDAFFSCLADSNDLKTCFEQAKAAVETTGTKQAPWMDDNGDGDYDAGDGSFASQRRVTQSFGSVRPKIQSTSV